MHKRFIGFASIRLMLKSKCEKTRVMRKENHSAEECETGCEICGEKDSGKLEGETLKMKFISDDGLRFFCARTGWKRPIFCPKT